MKQRNIIIIFITVFLIRTVLSGLSDANAELLTDNNELRNAVQRFLSTDAIDVRWAKTAKDTAIAVYRTEGGYGTAILSYDPSTGFSIAEKNDRMIPGMGSSSFIRLDDHTPEYSIEVRWDGQRETAYLTLQVDGCGIWRVQRLEYSRKEDNQEDTMVFCHLSEDGKTAVISPLVDPRIEWAVDQEFTVREFNLASAQELCENAIAILRDPEQAKNDVQEYRIVHVAMDRYEPVIPARFDSRMEDEEQLLYLFREEQDGRIQTEWTFHWEENKEAWILAAVRTTELNDPEPDDSITVTELRTEITAEAIHSIKQLKDKDSGEILYIYRDVTFPNVLDQESFFLKQFNFDTPPVNAEGYNWSGNWMAYADSELMPKLFQVFFPEHTYVDGYLQEDKTLTFIGRKADGTQVLLCGADEGGTGWEWVESTPLPEGARFGDENITDAVNLNAWNGGAAIGVRRTEKGRWGVYYANSYDFLIGPDWVGRYGTETNAQFFGSHAWGDITTIDWPTLPPEEYSGPETKEEKDIRLSAMVDRTDWATPAHSDMYEMTELLKEADRADSVLGRFYDGAPLFVLERGTEWTKVRIGHGEGAGVMTGWMRTADLAYGDDMLRISREAIRISSEQVLLHPVEPFIGSRAGRITSEQFGSCLVIGEAETDQGYAVVYNLKDGDVGLILMTSLGEGNG